jgi:hypothetical protein
MSITFTATTIEKREWDGELVDVHVPVAELDELAVNVSNVNARDILSFLGVEFDYCGTLSADELLGATLVAEAVAPRDPGHEGGADPRNPRMIECGRRPGYLNDRTAQIRALAEAAKAHGASVSWA